MDRISKLAGPFLISALIGLCLASGCSKDESGNPEPPDPPKPSETVMETFKKTTVPGVYDLSSTSLKPVVVYVEGENQYSFYTVGDNFWFGVTDLDKGVAFRAQVPVEMTVDNTYSLIVTSVGAGALSGLNGKQVTCVKAATALYWVVDNENGTGIILARKEL